MRKKFGEGISKEFFGSFSSSLLVILGHHGVNKPLFHRQRTFSVCVCMYVCVCVCVCVYVCVFSVLSM